MELWSESQKKLESEWGQMKQEAAASPPINATFPLRRMPHSSLPSPVQLCLYVSAVFHINSYQVYAIPQLCGTWTALTAIYRQACAIYGSSEWQEPGNNV